MEKDKSITSRPFRVLADCGKVYQFLIDIYEKDWRMECQPRFLSTLIRRSPTGWIYRIPIKIGYGRAMGVL